MMISRSFLGRATGRAQSLLRPAAAPCARTGSAARSLDPARLLSGLHASVSGVVPSECAQVGARQRAGASALDSAWPRAAAVARAPARGYATGGVDDFNIIPDDDGLVRITSPLEDGFIVGETAVQGSLMAAGDLLLLWHVDTLERVTPESLALLRALRPPPDLLVLGTGRRSRLPGRALLEALDKQGVAIEISDTVNAVATFNLLNQEGRKVVGAFLPSGVN